MQRFTSFHASALAVTFLASFVSLACSDDSKGQDDPLASADVVRCDMSDDLACIEYQRVRNGNVQAFVALDEARALCAGGWNGDSTKPGTFAEGACGTDSALARCNISRGYLQL